MLKWVKIVLLALLFLFIISIAWINSRFQVFKLRHTDEQLSRVMEDVMVPWQIKYQKQDSISVRYLEVADSLPVVILLHGAPSRLSMFQTYFTDSLLIHKAHLIIPDRPGYGYSGFEKPAFTVKEQAKHLTFLLKKFPQNKEIIILGNSYGGPVAAALAMENPELTDGLIFVSASLTPREEKIYSISYMINHPAFQWMFPRVIKTSNDEKLNHEESLETIDDQWHKINCPVTFIHGKKDGLIYPSNVTKTRKKLTTATKVVWLENEGHGFLLSKKELIRKEIISFFYKSYH